MVIKTPFEGERRSDGRQKLSRRKKAGHRRSQRADRKGNKTPDGQRGEGHMERQKRNNTSTKQHSDAGMELICGEGS